MRHLVEAWRRVAMRQAPIREGELLRGMGVDVSPSDFDALYEAWTARDWSVVGEILLRAIQYHGGVGTWWMPSWSPNANYLANYYGGGTFDPFDRHRGMQRARVILTATAPEGHGRNQTQIDAGDPLVLTGLWVAYSTLEGEESEYINTLSRPIEVRA